MMTWRMEKYISIVGRWSVCLRGMDGGEDGFVTRVLRKSTASFWPYWPLRSKTGHHGEISFLSPTVWNCYCVRILRFQPTS